MCEITITRSKIYPRPARVGYAWYWLYMVVGPDGYRSERRGLVDSRSWAKKRWPNIPINEVWK